jgi:hypothetical protein
MAIIDEILNFIRSLKGSDPFVAFGIIFLVFVFFAAYNYKVKKGGSEYD